MIDTVRLRNHAQRVLLHLSRAEGIREAGEDEAGEMAEAKRHLIAAANEFGYAVDPLDTAAQSAVEGPREEQQP